MGVRKKHQSASPHTGRKAGRHLLETATSPVEAIEVGEDVTNPKRAEEALRERAEIYRAIVDQAADGILLMDMETLRFVEFNDPACRELGYTREEFAAIHLLDIQAAMTPEQVSERLATVRRTGEGTFENRHFCKNGEILDRLVSYRVIHVRGHDFLAVIWMDITERKARQRDVERLNRLYAALIELNQTIGRVKSREELFAEVCRITAEKAGFRVVWIGWPDPETHVVVPIARAGPDKDYLDTIKVYADDRPEGRGPSGACLREGNRCILNRFVDDPRAAPWRAAALARGLLAVASLPIRFHGKVWATLTIYDAEPDVFQDKEVALLEEVAAATSLALDNLDQEAQRQRAEEALAAAAREWSVSFDAMADAVSLHSPDHTITNVNQSLCDMLCKNKDELIGKKCYQVFHGTDSPIAGCPHEKARATFRKESAEVFDRARNEWLAVSSSPVFDDAGRVVRFVHVVRDITARKRVEDDLLAATRAAQTANRAKSEFLANMSHEIRTPMTAILGFSDLLMAQNLSHGEQCEFLEGIRRNGRALLELIGDILDLSRIEADKLTLEKMDCPLQQIIDDMLAVVQVRAREKRLSLEVDRQYPLPERIHTDPLRLRQILVNLAGNAVKFTEHGEVRIAVRCIPRTDHTSRMQFAVSDTGIGIPPDKIGGLFQPFTQADASASRRYTGAGLGLAISKRLAKALGGDVEVASEPGKGSTFTLTVDAGSLRGVPMLQSPPPNSPSADESSADQQQLVFRGRLLLVEDDPDIQRIIRLLLRKMKLAVNVAKNGQTACDMADLSKAEGRPYDLILMDIQMPGMNGFEATQKLRGRGWQGPIIALTAHALAGDREKCLAAGCNDYIAKPVIATGLQEVLARHMAAHADTAPDRTAGRDEPDATGTIG